MTLVLDWVVWVIILTLLCLACLGILKVFVDYPGLVGFKCVYGDTHKDKLEIDLSEYEKAAIEIPDRKSSVMKIPAPILPPADLPSGSRSAGSRSASLANSAHADEVFKHQHHHHHHHHGHHGHGHGHHNNASVAAAATNTAAAAAGNNSHVTIVEPEPHKYIKEYKYKEYMDEACQTMDNSCGTSDVASDIHPPSVFTVTSDVTSVRSEASARSLNPKDKLFQDKIIVVDETRQC